MIERLPPPPPQPHYLPAGQLLVSYERLAVRGYPVAALRAAMLRRQIAYQPTEETSHEQPRTATC